MGTATAAAPVPAPHGLPNRDEPQPAIVERSTKDGRKLFYKLSVIQQPERARACGSGPKSSADRRPVDPPPVVELRIFEGPTWQEAQQKDITFSYNANFFLFATLEHARVIAHGRVQTPAANQPPVLTGMPVSGMAYLDRPVEAGYFLFPDLSVRHEGRYRLTFNLYEETKHDKDKDPDAPETKAPPAELAVAATGSFDFRMEVKSCDFVVYSAKKFPGLNSSTELSRCVAEQGCRVRIRRDVRMRRRERKSDYDDGEGEYPKRRTETPEARDYRARSMSGSVERTPFSADTPRRPSGVDYPPGFPSHSSAGGHLQFLGSASNPQYPPRPPSIPPSPSYQASQAVPFARQGSYAPPLQPAYSHPEQLQAQPYAPANPSAQRESASFKRSSEDSTRRQPAQIRPLHSEYADHNPAVAAASTSKVTLPPIDVPKTPVPSATPAVPTHSRAMASLRSPAGNALPKLLPHGGSNPPSTTTPLMATSVAGSKRTRDASFRCDNENSRYHNGAREHPQNTDTDDGPMVYVRADGSEIVVSHHLY